MSLFGYSSKLFNIFSHMSPIQNQYLIFNGRVLGGWIISTFLSHLNLEPTDR